MRVHSVLDQRKLFDDPSAFDAVHSSNTPGIRINNNFSTRNNTMVNTGTNFFSVRNNSALGANIRLPI